MKNNNYYLEKTKKARDLVYLDYYNLDGYSMKPKVKDKEAISVSKILLVNKDVIEKVIRKKINNKIQALLDFLNSDDSESSSGCEKSLMAAEKLRMQIIERYVKYLGNTYQKLTLQKLQIIINELRFKIFSHSLYTEPEIEYMETRGRGR